MTGVEPGAEEGAREEYLLAALRLGAGADPVPRRVSLAARAVFALRLPGGVPAAQVGVTAPAGARSADDTGDSGTAPGDSGSAAAPGAETRRGPGQRLRRFSAAGLTIDIETTVSGGRLDVAGQVSPPPGDEAEVEVRTPHISKVRALSATGQFAVTGLPPGWVSVVCRRAGQPPVFTRWVHVRP